MTWLQNSESQTWYADYMKWFVCYILWIAVTCSEKKDESSEKNEENEKDNEEENSLHDAQKLFFWHDDQKQLVMKMWQSLNADEKKSDSKTQILRMLTLLDSFIFQTADDESFHNSFIHFLTVLDIDEKMNWLWRADNFSFMLTEVIYCVWVLKMKILLSFNQQKHQNETKQEHFLQQ